MDFARKSSTKTYLGSVDDETKLGAVGRGDSLADSGESAARVSGSLGQDTALGSGGVSLLVALGHMKRLQRQGSIDTVLGGQSNGKVHLRSSARGVLLVGLNDSVVEVDVEVGGLHDE